MADLTRFDFHVVRFMNSMDVDMMSAEEIGQYILLLCKAWLLGKDATLPDDPKYLAHVARTGLVSELVMKKFPLVDTPEGRVRRNSTLYGEWLLALDRQNSASERGKKGNEVRYGSRYSENNSDTKSDSNSFAAAEQSRSPIPFHSIKHSTPIHSEPYQTKNNLNFAGGSYGQGDFKTISKRWWACFQKQLQKSKQNREQYGAACSTFNEDVLLNYLDIWAKDNQWVAAHPKGGNRLYVFLQALPEMIEGDELRVARETEERKIEGPEISEAEAEQIVTSSVSERQKEVSEQLRKIEEQKKWDEVHKDEI